VQVEEVAPQVMQSLSDTETPQGILAVLPFQHLHPPEKMDFVLILDEMRDPGNLGTILRTAAAAGVQVVYLSPGTVDPFSPKVLRAGMGAQFRLPLVELAWPEIQLNIQQASLRLLAATAGEGTTYTQADLRSPLALVIGGEAQGPDRCPQPGTSSSKFRCPAEASR
jgi:TrmH family RNA methyltransferase